MDIQTKDCTCVNENVICLASTVTKQINMSFSSKFYFKSAFLAFHSLWDMKSVLQKSLGRNVKIVSLQDINMMDI